VEERLMGLKKFVSPAVLRRSLEAYRTNSNLRREARGETGGRFSRFKTRMAIAFVRAGGRPYLWLNKFGNTTLGYEIGEYTYGHPVVLYPDGKLKIGKFCSIAWNVTIFLGGNHRVDWIATYPFPTPDGRWPKVQDKEHEYLGSKGDVTIGNDVWIGSDVTILSGVTIGDGAVIGTGSVVTADVEPYAIVAGNPAKLIKKRFTDEEIATLLDVRWWDWPIEKVRENVDVLCSGDIVGLAAIS
jgi:acetyltransferase-like isoleucine patch superfamily enzyme